MGFSERLDDKHVQSMGERVQIWIGIGAFIFWLCHVYWNILIPNGVFRSRILSSTPRCSSAPLFASVLNRPTEEMMDHTVPVVKSCVVPDVSFSSVLV